MVLKHVSVLCELCGQVRIGYIHTHTIAYLHVISFYNDVTVLVTPSQISFFKALRHKAMQCQRVLPFALLILGYNTKSSSILCLIQSTVCDDSEPASWSTDKIADSPGTKFPFSIARE